jgi:hypothetical protein
MGRNSCLVAVAAVILLGTSLAARQRGAPWLQLAGEFRPRRR